MTTPFVQYAYANGSANTVRPTGITYPDGRVISQDYGTADGMNDAASRVASLIDDDNTHLADYSYLGERSFVVADSPEPEVKWTLASLAGSNDPDTGDIYSGLDRFGRVKDNRWYDYGASADADRIQYGYDRAGNRTWRQNTVAEALSKPFDELYGNDLIHRLKQLSRGILNGSKDDVTDKSIGECWSLDATGNWQKYLEDTDGDGNWDLNQARTANTVNEITGISESAGPAWATPAYNAAGNMTTVPQPADPTKTYTAVYDAWNRLVRLVDDDTSQTVAEYQYDGANRRTVQKSYSGGVLAETRHLYYTQPSQWQVVEERVDAETDPDRQFVWGQRYIDDLILRDRDTNGDGSLNERLYALQDANWNVTGLVSASGDVQERYAYSAYGTPLFLTSAFVPQGNSSFDWETLYAGYRWETATELFHVRHRVLNSALGVWCQRDPLGLDSGLNLISYVSLRPIIWTDPSGQLGPVAWVIIAVVAGVAIYALIAGGVEICRRVGAHRLRRPCNLTDPKISEALDLLTLCGRGGQRTNIELAISPAPGAAGNQYCADDESLCGAPASTLFGELSVVITTCCNNAADVAMQLLGELHRREPALFPDICADTLDFERCLARNNKYPNYFQRWRHPECEADGLLS